MRNMVGAKKGLRRDSLRTRTKLLEATIDLVAREGPAALSLKAAARIANVSRATAYQHFVDRNHLLHEAKAWLSMRLTASFAGERDPASTTDRIFLAARLVLANREASQMLLADALAGQELTPDQPLYQLTMASLKQFVTDGYGQSDMDLEILLSVLLGSIASIIMLSYRYKDGDINSLARRFADEYSRILCEGIIAKPVQTGGTRACKVEAQRNLGRRRSGFVP